MNKCMKIQDNMFLVLHIEAIKEIRATYALKSLVKKNENNTNFTEYEPVNRLYKDKLRANT